MGHPKKNSKFYDMMPKVTTSQYINTNAKYANLTDFHFICINMYVVTLGHHAIGFILHVPFLISLLSFKKQIPRQGWIWLEMLQNLRFSF